MTEHRRDSFTAFLVAKGRKDGIVSLDSDYGLGTDDVIEACADLTAKQADACLRAAKKILRTDPRDAEIARLKAQIDEDNRVILAVREQNRQLRAALAANAELRAALEHWTHVYGAALKPPGADTYGEGMRDAKDQVRALLSRPDLGAGKVLVERAVVERVRDVLQRLPRAGWGYTDAERAAVADLDALLKKGGG